jgi:nucleoside-diphosphate-sugar epimerase
MLHITFTDLTDREAVFRACAQHQPGAIIHLAAVVSPVCYAIPESARRVNVEGTRHLLKAANSLETAPLFICAPSSAVYGSRNPYTRDIINANTPVRPVECYGVDKIDGEKLVGESPLPYAILRLAGILSPDGIGNLSAEYSALVRATPGDNRVHGIDARDVALAFANASQLPEEHQNRLFMIAGDDSYRKTQREIEDDVVQAPGIGRLGEGASLPGDPGDELGRSFTDWMDVGDFPVDIAIPTAPLR